MHATVARHMPLAIPVARGGGLGERDSEGERVCRRLQPEGQLGLLLNLFGLRLITGMGLWCISLHRGRAGLLLRPRFACRVQISAASAVGSQIPARSRGWRLFSALTLCQAHTHKSLVGIQ